MRIIINADDCGRSKEQNVAIEKAILSNKITSTSIMANMPLFDDAVRLYQQYNSTISFGVHLNLSEGIPLRYSQPLLDVGFYLEDNDSIIFNGMSFLRKKIEKKYLQEIKKELILQINKLRDSGIQISHIDGHNHIHTATFMFFLLPEVCKETGINKVRNIWNLMPPSFSLLKRNMWTLGQKIQNRDIKLTDKFASFSNYKEWKGIVNGRTMEIMCHPGHPRYLEEEKDLYKYVFSKEIDIINYNDL